MADAHQVRRLALSLDGVEEIASDGFDFRVGGKGFVWSYPERVPGKRRVIRTDIAVLFVGDEAEKQALLLGRAGALLQHAGVRPRSAGHGAARPRRRRPPRGARRRRLADAQRRGLTRSAPPLFHRYQRRRQGARDAIGRG